MILLAVASAFAAGAGAQPPLQDAVGLNIGLNCQWQQRCIAKQNKAMKRALSYVRRTQPPAWRVQLCNRNASRNRSRVDWIGFDNCIRNATLRPLPARVIVTRKRARPVTRSDPPPSYAIGERGR